MDAVQRGVELAYRVSEEYLKQGQSFARTASQPFSSLTQPGGSSQAGGPSNPLPQLTERMLRYTSELSTMWMEAMRMMSNGTNGGPGVGFPFPPSPRAEAPAAPQPAPSSARSDVRVGIQIDSKLRTRATLDLPDTKGRPIVVDPLKLEGGTAHIRRVEVEREDRDGSMTIVVAVPGKQVPGTYVATIRDATTKGPVGTVRIRVSR